MSNVAHIETDYDEAERIVVYVIMSDITHCALHVVDDESVAREVVARLNSDEFDDDMRYTTEIVDELVESVEREHRDAERERRARTLLNIETLRLGAILAVFAREDHHLVVQTLLRTTSDTIEIRDEFSTTEMRLASARLDVSVDEILARLDESTDKREDARRVTQRVRVSARLEALADDLDDSRSAAQEF